MRRLGLVAALLLVVGALAACQITITYTAPTNPTPVPANTDGNTPVASGVPVPPGSTIYYDVSLGSAVRSYDALFVMLDPGPGGPDLNLVLKDYSTYAPVASSSSPDYFAPGTLGTSSVAEPQAAHGATAAPQSIGVGQTCYSSCIIQPNRGASHYYVGIGNPTASTVYVDLYAYGYVYDDTNEPANDHMSSAPTLFASSSDSGAIETIGDSDFWRVQYNGDVTFSVTSSIFAMRVSVYSSNGTRVAGPYTTADSPFYAYDGEYLRVYSANDYAGPSGSSRYDLSH